MKKSTIIAQFNSPIETVWNVITDNTVFNWRSDLDRIEIGADGNSFTEYTKQGFETKFIITQKKPYECYEFDMKNKNIKGHWTGVFRKDGSGTIIEFTEEVQVANPIMNLFVKSYLKKQQSTYISDLRKVLGE
ncbi:MAG: SRPBCC family protein [Anaerovoracaceae bacterium]